MNCVVQESKLSRHFQTIYYLFNWYIYWILVKCLITFCLAGFWMWHLTVSVQWTQLWTECITQSSSTYLWGIACGKILAHYASAKATLYPLRIPALNFYLTTSTNSVWSIHFESLEVKLIQSMSVLGEKKRIILWINPAIIHVELWKIFCTLISSSGKTNVDLCSNWNNQHVKSCTWRTETRENRSYSTNSLSVFFTNERWLFCGYILLTPLTQLLPRMWKRMKPFNQSYSRVTSFVCTGREEGRCTLRGPKARGDRMMLYRVCCNNYCGKNRVGPLILYVVNGLTISRCSFSQRLHLSVSGK